ncbi:hypothetical protein AV530_002812 [Patagioenas fasciata monilis]|uniref:Uncharacterized protein n=1 Tax=Patagioenas fasciata monilis TaxID=372326 RepID=A0A1V4JKI9_PATFA|nr:hypothetical protein AV530_002812 [Patagioenas fasciata monilis]
MKGPAGADVPPEPMEDPSEEEIHLQPIEDPAGAEIHLQPMEDPAGAEIHPYLIGFTHKEGGRKVLIEAQKMEGIREVQAWEKAAHIYYSI